jgi:hypothetical protein
VGLLYINAAVISASMAGLLSTNPLCGQTASAWLDPPEQAENARPSLPASSEQGEVYTPQHQSRESDRAIAARVLAIEYLAFWSAPNSIALRSTPNFYAPEIVFHGRTVNISNLLREKRQFVRRWPFRHFAARLETMRVSCDAASPNCTVRTEFDFTAGSARMDRLSRGSALLELGVTFASGERLIEFERSKIISRSPNLKRTKG